MTEGERPLARPAWVRALAKDRATRAGAHRQRIGFWVIACLGLGLFAVESSSDTALGAIVRPLALGAAAVGLTLGAWASVAIRWVDRHGVWA